MVNLEILECAIMIEYINMNIIIEKRKEKLKNENENQKRISKLKMEF